MDAPSPFSDREMAFLGALVSEGVEFLVVGLAAATLQGAPAVTLDVDLWVADLGDPRFSMKPCGSAAPFAVPPPRHRRRFSAVPGPTSSLW